MYAQKNVLFAGVSLLSTVAVIATGLILKHQASKTANTVVDKLYNINKQDWFQALKQWLKECPVKPTIEVHKPFEASLTAKGY